MGGVRHFEKLGLDDLSKLFERNFIDPEDAQNESPTAKEMCEFMQRHPSFTCHGYAVSPDRNDYRVTIEGVERNGAVTMEMFVDFVSLFRYADEFEASQNGLYCWYD